MRRARVLGKLTWGLRCNNTEGLVTDGTAYAVTLLLTCSDESGKKSWLRFISGCVSYVPAGVSASASPNRTHSGPQN